MTKKNTLLKFIFAIIFLFIIFLVYAFSSGESNITIDGGKIILEFNKNFESRVIANYDGQKVILGKFRNSESINTDRKSAYDFKITDYKVRDWKDSLGIGKEYELSGSSKDLLKKVSIVSYKSFPTMLFFNVTYKNIGDSGLTVDGWENNNYNITSNKTDRDEPFFWSYQPGSYGWDNNWILPISAGFSRDNYLGMTYADYGGGTPVVDIWRKDFGIAVGHVEMVPKLVSLPVIMKSKDDAELGIDYKKKNKLNPGEEISTFRTFVNVHKGDCFNSLAKYREFMELQGVKFRNPPKDAYGSEWCGWGYEQNFTMDEIYNTLPKVKELGLDWVVLDMGWYKGMGDYYLPKDKFPNGDADIKKFVEKVHSYGLKVQLWWMPLAVGPQTDLMDEHPDYLLLNKDGSPQYMPSFFKSFFLCPASKTVQEYSKQLVIKFMKWGFDGLKIDGDNQNCVPLCYNPAHHHQRPEESVEAIPAFYKMVYETALSINPNAKIEICPCGTNQSFFLMPYMNETVASDPHSSWQIRLKGKVLRALNPTAVFYGDHVELSDNKSDFASTIGVGGTIGTKFVYPPGVHMNTESGDVSLTPEKEKIWEKWIDIYKTNMLSKGEYRGDLYDIGFDRPETHAVQKGDTMYYAFYAPKYSGKVGLRGLKNSEYKIFNYENNQELGNLKGPVGYLNVSFKNHLLIKVYPSS